jgi:hypothetical protein
MSKMPVKKTQKTPIFTHELLDKEAMNKDERKKMI